MQYEASKAAPFGAMRSFLAVLSLFHLASALNLRRAVKRPHLLDADQRFAADGSGPLDFNIWQGHSIANAFEVMDDLQPVAPMDRLTEAGPKPEVPSDNEAPEPLPLSGRQSNAIFVPPYMRPDAFPVVHGSPCTCGPASVTESLTKMLPGVGQPVASSSTLASDRQALERAYGKAVIDRLYVQAAAESGKQSCVCTGGSGDGSDAYHWVRMTPVYNSSKYVLSPADVTYGNGDYWLPHAPGGIAAPADKYPAKEYPLQARADRVKTLPTTAREDKIETRFTRYIDQVADRAKECDNVSPECTVDCSTGDKVKLQLGSTLVDATVLSAHVGNALQVRFVPSAEAGNPAVPFAFSTYSYSECGIEAGCTVFRPCYTHDASGCVEEEEVREKDFKGDWHTKLQCPTGTSACRSVVQLVSASYVRKGEKACRAFAPPVRIA